MFVELPVFRCHGRLSLFARRLYRRLKECYACLSHGSPNGDFDGYRRFLANRPYFPHSRHLYVLVFVHSGGIFCHRPLAAFFVPGAKRRAGLSVRWRLKSSFRWSAVIGDLNCRILTKLHFAPRSWMQLVTWLCLLLAKWKGTAHCSARVSICPTVVAHLSVDAVTFHILRLHAKAHECQVRDCDKIFKKNQIVGKISPLAVSTCVIPTICISAYHTYVNVELLLTSHTSNGAEYIIEQVMSM